MSSFTIIPAVDIKDGRCVRLAQGRADAVTVYSDKPVEVARRWESEGARYLHVVDLDGAFQGHAANSGLIAELIAAVRIPVEVGGGLRGEDDIRRMLDAGAARVILGTRACEDRTQLEHLAGLFSARLAVGIDARDGRVQVRGWTETTDFTAIELARAVDAIGVATLIVTDTATDGMMKGVNVLAMDQVSSAVNAAVIASGGVTSPDDVRALIGLGRPNLIGAIVGKALYEGRVQLKDLQQAALYPDA
jgi:phosphoribosylformimino-5-aminoimidazole carboxamide ribotide isomerase